MASGSHEPPHGPSSGSTGDNPGFRQFSLGTIRHVMYEPGQSVVASDVPEIFLRLAGRGRIYWDGAPNKDRSGAAIFLPPGQGLVVKGQLRALRTTLPRLTAGGPIYPMSDVLISVLCPRAWSASELVAEASFTLMQLLVEEDLAKRAMKNDRSPRNV